MYFKTMCDTLLASPAFPASQDGAVWCWGGVGGLGRDRAMSDDLRIVCRVNSGSLGNLMVLYILFEAGRVEKILYV